MLVNALQNVSRLAIIILNPYSDENLARKAVEVVYRYYEYRGIKPVLISNVSRVFRAKALVFSINPTGLVIVEDLGDFEQTMLLIVKWTKFMDSKSIDRSALSSAVLGSSSIVEARGFKFIGYIGLITKRLIGSVCGEVTGYIAVKIDYYYANVNMPGGVYHAWLAHIEHAAKGYQTKCCSLFGCFTHNHYPKLFISKTDWHTDERSGQVLYDWEPKNVGTAITVTYTITLGVNTRVRVTYSIPKYIATLNGPYYEWYDISDPPYGIVATRYYLVVPKSFDISKLSNVLFTVEQAS